MKNNVAPSNLAWLDAIRILSIVLVMYGHFTMVGGHATSIPGIINPSTSLPLMDGTKNSAAQLEIFLINAFSTQSAVLGVALFFMVTGYLMPRMMERYSRRDFLINRFFRIFPTLVAATLLTGLYLRLTQQIDFSPESYFSSWTLTYLYLGIAPVMGVLWTLVIEVIFYLVSAMMGRFSVIKLLMLQGGLLALLAYGSNQITPAGSAIQTLANQSVYFLYICIGVAFYLAEQDPLIVHKIAPIFQSLALSYIGFQFHKLGLGSAGTYENLGTHLVACALFGCMLLLHKLHIMTKIPAAASWFADLVYPIYLFHTAIGLATMAVARKFSSNSLLMVTAAVIVTLVVSWLVHRIVEKPFLRIGRKLTSATRQRASAATSPLQTASR